MTGDSSSADRLVLIADDDTALRESLAAVARSEGYETAEAGDGQAALSAALRLRPALIILDLMMPGLGGFEVLRELQRGPAASIPVIVLTGHYAGQSTAEIFRREPNVADFLEKPADRRTLIRLLRKTLG